MDPSSWAYQAAQAAHYAAATSRLRAAPGGAGPGGGGGGPASAQTHHHSNHGAAHSHSNQMYAANQMQLQWMAFQHQHHHQSSQHPDAGSTFVTNPFGLPPHPHPHPAVASYDTSGFLPSPFQSAAAKASYLQSPSSFYKQMGGKDSEMSNLRATGFPPPATHCGSMAPPHAPGMGHHPNHPDATGMAAAATGASLFSSHLAPGSWRHHPNLIATHNAGSANTGETRAFGILPHETVSNGPGPLGTGIAAHSHSGSSSNHSNKSCSVESGKHHHHHKANASVSVAATAAPAASFGNMMTPAMTQGAHPTGVRGQGAHFDHLASAAKLSHHHQSDSYLTVENVYMSAARAAAAAAAYPMNASNQHMLGMTSGVAVSRASASQPQYPGMNFPSSDRLTREMMGVPSSTHPHPAKQGSNSSCHSSSGGRTNLGASGGLPANNYHPSCSMMMPGMSANNYSPSPAHGGHNANHVANHANSVGNVVVNNTSRSSSAASNHAIQQQGSESSSCSFGYNSPSHNTNLPHSPYQRTNVPGAAVASSQPTVPAPTSNHVPCPVNNVQDFASNGYGNQGSGYPSMGTPGSASTPAYPTPPSSVNQVVGQSHGAAGPGGDDGLSHFSSMGSQTSSQAAVNSYETNFNSSSYSNASKMPSTPGPPSVVSNNSSSCMVAAAAARLDSNSNSSVNNGTGYLHNSIASNASLRESEADGCLSNIVSVTSISDGMSEANKMNDSQMSSTGSVVIGGQAEPNLGSVYAEQEIDFLSISCPTGEESAGNYTSLRLEGHALPASGHKKKKDKTKKHKKKDRTKGIAVDVGVGVGFGTGVGTGTGHATDGISVNANNYSPYFHPITQFHDSQYTNQVNSQSCNSYQMHPNHQQQQQQHQLQPSPNMMPNNAVTEATPCYGSGSLNMQNNLMNEPLTSQITPHQLQPQTGSDLDLDKSEATQSQTLIHNQQLSEQHSQIHPTALATTTVTHDHQEVDQKSAFDGLEDDLSFLTEAAECEGVSRNEVGTQATTDPTETHSIPSIETSSVATCTDNRSSSVFTSCLTASAATNTLINNHVNGDRSLTSDSDSLGGKPNEGSGFLTYASDNSRSSPGAVSQEASTGAIEPNAVTVTVSTSTSTSTATSVDNNVNIGLTGNVKISNKKKKKHKESKEGKAKTNSLNGQKPKPCKRLTIIECSSDGDSGLEMSRKHPSFSPRDDFSSKFAQDGGNGKRTGENKDYESRFFKTRPLANLPPVEADIKVRTESKGSRKRKSEENKKADHDEYEFQESPNPSQSKKSKKSVASTDGNVKKKTVGEKPVTAAVSVGSSISFKKSASNSKSKSNNVSLNVSNAKVAVNVKCDDKVAERVAIDSKLKQTKEVLVTSDSEKKQKQPQPQPQISLHINLSPKGGKQTTIPLVASALHNQQPSLPQQSLPPTVQKQPQHPQQQTHQQNASPVQQQPPVVSPHLVNNIKKNSLANNKKEAGSLTNSKTSQSVAMQSMGTNTPRRRSQDKKALTIREGLMRTGDFVVALEEVNCDLPMIWRIEGKSLLQRFEPSEQDAIIVYTNTSSYSAWNPTVRQKYTGVDVRVMGCSRTKIIVEKLGLTKNNPAALNGDSTAVERCRQSASSTSYQEDHPENFEVFIQTLVSQALDPNFIAEIVKENDEYFLSHVQAIDDFCCQKKSRFFSRVKWDAHVVKCVETYPTFDVIPQNNVGDLRCRLCHDNWSTQILHFTGDPYDQMTLETREPVDIKQTKYAACDQCKERIALFSRLHHQKYNFFMKCREKVEEIRGGDENKESHVILEQCLNDHHWIQMQLFKELDEIWSACDRLR